MPILALVNHSTQYPQTDLAAFAIAFQTAVSRDFRQIYLIEPFLVKVIPQGQNPPLGSWVIGIFDNADQPGALGYHDETPDGLPLGKCFYQTTIQDGGIFSVTISHEGFEMLADPWLNRCAAVNDAQGNVTAFEAYEVADACEDDQYAYDINGVKISDFCYPAWFEPYPNASRFDFQKKISQPGQILTNGYIGFWTPQSGWQQKTADGKLVPATIGSRHDRRARRGAWIRSTYTPA